MSLTLPPDQTERDFAIDPTRSVLLRAPAGSGKTGVLLLRYLNCLLTVSQPEQVVAITFTNKAAGEIRERVLNALRVDEQAGAPAPVNAFDASIRAVVLQVLQRDRELNWQLLENSTRLRIQTFDSFCASLTRRLPLLSGLGVARPLTDTDALYRQAILELFRQIEQPEQNRALSDALLRLLAYGSNRIESLIPLMSSLLAKRDQWQADILRGDIAVMEAVLREEVDAVFQHCLKLLRRADIDALLAAFALSSTTVEIHAWAATPFSADRADLESLALLRATASAMLNNDGNIYSSRSLRYAGFDKGSPAMDAAKSWLLRLEEGDSHASVEQAFRQLRDLPDPAIPPASRQLIDDFGIALLHLLAHLRLVFEQRGGVDFGEIAQRAIHALRDDGADLGEAVLDEQRIAHILVDEMQDTSVSQIELLTRLCQSWEPDDGRSVFFCGDLQQSIYAFRGSLVSLFDELIQARFFAGRTLEVLQLDANFRSSPDLVNWVNAGFETIFGDRGKEYHRAKPQRDISGRIEVHAAVQAQSVKAEVQVATREAADIVDIIQRIQRDDAGTGRCSSIGILVRGRAHLNTIIPALKRADIAFSGQEIDVLDQTPAVLDFTALMRALWHDADDVAWVRLLRAAFVGLSWEDIRCLRSCSVPLRDAVMAGDDLWVAAGVGAAGRGTLTRICAVLSEIERRPESRDLRWALSAAWHELGGPATVSAQAYQDIDRIFILLDEHAQGGILQDISAVERALEKLYATPAAAPVEIMTVHKSKGLEFDVVLLPGLGRRGRNNESALLAWRRQRGHMLFAPRPQAAEAVEAQRYYAFLDATQREELEAELDRQIYVALTRARRELHLFGLASTNSKGDITAEKNSYLGHLWPVLSPYFEGSAGLPPPMLFEQSDVPPPMAIPTTSRIDNLRIDLGSYYQAPLSVPSALTQAQRFSEHAVLEDNIEQRAVGIVFHELMERIGRGGDVAAWQSTDTRHRQRLTRSITQRLRHHCHPEPGLTESVGSVIQLLDNTLTCDTGRWILGSYQWQGSEQALRRYVGGQWQTLILDRVFVEQSDEGERCWIVDYKTARAGADTEQFLAEQAVRYGEKMALYREALRATGVECPIFAALYFPAHQRLVVLDQVATTVGV